MSKLLKKTTIVLFILLLTFIVFMLVNNYALSTRYSAYHTVKVQDKLNIVAISDLHGKKFGIKNKRLAQKITKLAPDIIIMAGDMFGKNADGEAVIDFVRSLNKSCPNIYFSFGNHESRETESREQMVALLQKEGVCVLNNQKATFKKNDTVVNIYGLELPLYFYTGYDGEGELVYSLEKQKINDLIGESSENLNILIAHNPIYFDAYADWGADIVISGHNHGGVVRLPFIGAVASPNGDKKPLHYDCGEYENGKATMFLSRGLGEWVGPVRVFNLPEIYCISVTP